MNSPKRYSDTSEAMLAARAADSIRDAESDIVKKWLIAVIDDLEISSLKSFPAGELATDLPKLIAYMADSLGQAESTDQKDDDIASLAAIISTVRKNGPRTQDVLADYSMLRRLLLDAAAVGMRSADRVSLSVVNRIDETFMPFFQAGLEALLAEKAARLQYLADTDPLTGLYNVRYFRRQLHSNLQMFKRYQVPFSLMMIDLNRLKYLNDTYGHTVGDVALKHLARVLRAEKREIDIAVRYGGDEFFLLLPGTLTEEAHILARRIAKHVQEIRENTGGREITSVSIGIAECPRNGTDIGTLRAKADRAVYHSKNNAGGSIAVFDEESGAPGFSVPGEDETQGR